MIEQERRRFERLLLAPALNARLRAQQVRVVDIGPSGSRVERGTLYFVDDERQEIWAKIAGGLSGEIRLPIGQGLAGSVAATGQEVVIHDAYTDPRFDQSTDVRSGFRTRSMLCVPIRNRD